MLKYVLGVIQFLKCFVNSSLMFKFKYKVHIKKDLRFIVLTFIFATVPSSSETFGLSALRFGLNALQNWNYSRPLWPCPFCTLFRSLILLLLVANHFQLYPVCCLSKFKKQTAPYKYIITHMCLRTSPLLSSKALVD